MLPPAQQMRIEATQRVELFLVPPDGVKLGEGRVRRLGPVVYRAVRAAMKREVSLTVAEFVADVWGTNLTPCEGTVRTAVHRVNGVLELIGCPRRLVVDAGVVSWAG